MNNVFKKVWSASRGAYVAVSEIASSHGKSGGVSGALLACVLLACSTQAQAVAANALPTGGQVSAGAVSINTAGNVLTVNQSSQRAAINWQSFSIGSNGVVNFVQPDVASVTLNRVVGNEQSVIAGALNANGQVFLLNSSGVLFTSGAQVNVGGIVASTLNISDADFIAGKTAFTSSGVSGGVLNLGSINATDGGYVALLGNQVSNQGVITARLGTAALAAGDKVSLNFNGNSLVGVTIDQGTLNALVENKQAIHADGGLVVLTAKGLDAVLATVVNNTGEISAQTVADREGKIYLLGGMDNNRIEVGGTLDASAPNGGNGGFIETSAAKVKIAEGLRVNTSANSGTTGDWLIDPKDFTIAASGGDITGAQLGTNLESSNVTIDSATGGVAGNGSIYVQDSILKAAGGNTTLTLKAQRDITIDSGVSISSTSNKLNVYLSANNDGLGSRSITINPNVTITTNGGDFIAGGALVTGAPSADQGVDIAIGGGANTTQLTSINAGSGDIKLYANALTFNAYTHLTAANITADTQDITVNYRDGVQIRATNALSFTALGGINVQGSYSPPAGSAFLTTDSETSLNAGNSMVLDAGGSLTLTGTSVRLTNPTGVNALTLRSGGSIDLEETSFGFSGTPNLTILLSQNSAQSDVGTYDPNYSDLSSYLAGTSTSLYKFVTEVSGALRTYGAHFGLKGGSYTLGVYSGTTPQSIAPKSLDNGLLASGNGLADSIDEGGNLRQPFYFDPSLDRWFKLTYSAYPLALAFGFGGTSTSGWNNDGTILSSDDTMNSFISGLTVDTTGLANGVGVVKVGYDLDLNGTGTVHMSHDYSLGSGESFIKTVTNTTNIGGAQVDNGRLWVGTYDDYVVISDRNVKTKGNLTASGFTPISSQNEQARSIIISEFDPSITGSPGGAVLFHSTNVGADTVTDSCCSFDNIYNKDPRASDIVTPTQDGSYGIFMNYGNMAAGATRTVTWYYGAGPLASIQNIATQVATLGGGLQIQAPDAVTSTPTNLTAPIATAINAPASVVPPVFATGLPPQGGSATSPVPNVVNPPPFVTAAFGGQTSLLLVSSPDAGAPTQPVTLSQARSMLGGSTDGDTAVRVPVSRNSLEDIVNGGLRLPDGVEQELFVVTAE